MDSELTIIGKKYNTDKSTYHGFTDFYNKHLSEYRDEFENILEIHPKSCTEFLMDHHLKCVRNTLQNQKY